MLYAVTIAADAPHAETAAEFVKALYGEAGWSALHSAFQQPLPTRIGGDMDAAPQWFKMAGK